MMRPKTASEVVSDLIKLIIDTPLHQVVTGDVYRSGTRPLKREGLEDIIVVHTASNGRQKQEGVVTLNIYVPLTDSYESGQMVRNTLRIEELEVMAANWVEDLSSGDHPYTFELQDSIYTMSDRDTEADFIVIALNYTIFNINI